MAQMTERELKNLLEARIAEAAGGDNDAATTDRLTSMRYYRGKPFGDEIEGRSQVVSTDVADAIDSIMPGLMRVFMAGDETVRFEPTGPEDEAAASQATDYVNWIFNQQNQGFNILHAWFKDALLSRLGVVKVWWEETEEYQRESYRGLTAAEYQQIGSDPDIEVVSASPSEVALPAMPDGSPPPLLLDVTVRRRRESGCVKVAGVPPDEFLFEPSATDLEGIGFTAHRCLRTIASLLNDGYDRDKVMAIPSGSETEFSSERQERFEDTGITLALGTDTTSDPLMREVEVTECYIRVDFDGDDVPELRRVLIAGSGGDILENEEVDGHPFAALTPIPMPHALVGESIADKVRELQRVKSTLWRQALDNLYLANNRRMAVVEGQVNLDDLLVSRPGGIVREKASGMVRPLDFSPVGREAFAMIEYVDTVREQRTGVTRYNQGLDADSLNKTATGIQIIANAAEQRIELIARVFAETGVKRLFRRILELVCKYQSAPKMIRLRGKWVPMDPRDWNDRMDLTVSVGIGTGNKTQQMNSLMTLAQMNEKIIAMQGGANGPLLTLPNVYALMKKLVEASGLKSVESYYTDPSDQALQRPKAPPPPDPAIIEAQQRSQLEGAKLGHEVKKTQAELALKERELTLKERQAITDAQLGQQKLQMEAATRAQPAAQAEPQPQVIVGAHGETVKIADGMAELARMTAETMASMQAFVSAQAQRDAAQDARMQQLTAALLAPKVKAVQLHRKGGQLDGMTVTEGNA